MSSVLIKNGSVIDGSGAKEQRLDVFVKDEIIADLGNFSDRKADIVVDATGMIVTPGFIDLNTASDHYLSLFTDPFQKKFLKQGVTSIVGGLHGSSLAPVVYGDLDSLRKWTDVNQVNIDWASFSEFLDLIRKKGLGVNFSSFVGYSTLKRAVGADPERDLSSEEMDKLRRMANDCIDAGAVGVSIGLFHKDMGHVSNRELEEIFRLCSAKNALIAVQARFDGENLSEAVEEIVALSNRFDVKTIVNTLVVIKKHEREYRKAIELIEESKNVYFDTHGFDHQTLPIHMLLPAEFRFGGIEKMLDFVQSDLGQETILENIGKLNGDKFIIASAPNFDFLVGRTLKEFSANHALTVAKGLVKLMEMTRLRCVLFVENLNSKEMKEALGSERAFFASSNPSMLSRHNVIDHPGGSANAFLNYLAEAENLEYAIKKITGDAAEFMGFEDRGLIREGRKADLVVLSDRVPQHVFIAGRLVVESGTANNHLEGEVLTKVAQ